MRVKLALILALSPPMLATVNKSDVSKGVAEITYGDSEPAEMRGLEVKSFIFQMSLHRERVKRLALMCLELFPLDFDQLTTEAVVSYLGLHDLPKTQTLEQLRSQGYSDRRSLSSRLARFYGRSMANLKGHERDELQLAIDQLNTLEATQKHGFFQNRKLSKIAIEQLELLEEIADSTDTGRTRQTEMGIANQDFNGERFLLASGKRRAAFISRQLETLELSRLRA